MGGCNLSYEKGGRADKLGNRFEYKWTIYNLLRVVEEKIQYIEIEAIGKDEAGIDLWVGNKDGSREGQQCKGRHESDEQWSYSTANKKGIFTNWKNQLERDDEISVSLVSPLAFTLLEDLTIRARNTNGSPEDFYQYQIDNANHKVKQLYKNYCRIMGIDDTAKAGIGKSIDYLARTYYRQRSDSEFKEELLDKISMLFIGNPSDIYAKLLDLIISDDVFFKKNRFAIHE